MSRTKRANSYSYFRRPVTKASRTLAIKSSEELIDVGYLDKATSTSPAKFGYVRWARLPSHWSDLSYIAEQAMAPHPALKHVAIEELYEWQISYHSPGELSLVTGKWQNFGPRVGRLRRKFAGWRLYVNPNFASVPYCSPLSKVWAHVACSIAYDKRDVYELRATSSKLKPTGWLDICGYTVDFADLLAKRHSHYEAKSYAKDYY